MEAEAIESAGRRRNRNVKKQEVTIGYYCVNDVMVILGCCRTKAQNIIRDLNDELESQGYGRWPKGKISKTYFNKKYF